MTARLVPAYVIDCNVCSESLEDGDSVARFDDLDEACQAAIDSGWTDLGDYRHACTRTNTAHRIARLAVTR